MPDPRPHAPTHRSTEHPERTVKLTLTLAMDNAAFTEDGNPGIEAARLLRVAADALEGGRSDGRLRDYNGTTVGRWAVEDDAEEEVAAGSDRSTAPDAQPWDAQLARSLRDTAHRELHTHGHPWTWEGADEEELTRENCAACVLGGYGAEPNEHGHEAPNHSSWARIYVQAQRVIPAAWRAAFTDDLGAGTAYSAALARDVATWGLVGWPATTAPVAG